MKQFKKSPVVFDEERHEYHLGEKRLLGITGLIHSILGLGVYPDANEFVKDNAIPRAGSKGTAVHHAIQTYDELGVKQTTQVVRTKYGCKERNNERVVDETWDVSNQLEAYIEHLRGFRALANELTVSDNVRYASQIDNVWLNEQTNSIWLVDTKTNNVALYPTCGYFNPDYFTDGKEALKEYLSWQLSIYAVLFEDENPGIEVVGLACNWLREDDAELWEIERKPDHLVRELLRTEYIFTDNGPVYFYPGDLSIFGIGKNLPEVREEAVPVIPQDVVDYMTNLVKAEKDIKQKIEDAKAGLRAAMQQHGVKSYDFGTFTATLSADSKTTKFDTKQFKTDHPDLYKAYTSEQTRNGGLTIKIKE